MRTGQQGLKSCPGCAPEQAQTPSAEDRAQRDDVVGRIDALVRSGLDNNKRLFITAYGSFLSGLYSPNGDLDLSIEGLVGRQCAPMITTHCTSLLMKNSYVQSK